MDDVILIEKSEGILTLSINNPPRNGLSRAVLQRFLEIEPSFHEPDVDVIIVTGHGRHFSAGADIDEMPNIPNKDVMEDYAAQAGALFELLARSNKPLIAAINGTCLGGGLELALCCHFRVAGDKAMMGLPEIELGLIPGLGGTQRLPRLIGETRAMDMILFGKTVRGQQALDIGLVHRIAPRKEVMEVARKLAGELQKRHQDAVRKAVRSVRAASQMPVSAGLELERGFFVDLWERRFKKGEQS